MSRRICVIAGQFRLRLTSSESRVRSPTQYRDSNDSPLNHLIAEFGRLNRGRVAEKTLFLRQKLNWVVSPEGGLRKISSAWKAFSSRSEPRATPNLSSSVSGPLNGRGRSILLATVQELDRPSQHGPYVRKHKLDAFATGVLAHIAADFMVKGGVKDHVSPQGGRLSICEIIP